MGAQRRFKKPDYKTEKVVGKIDGGEGKKRALISRELIDAGIAVRFATYLREWVKPLTSVFWKKRRERLLNWVEGVPGGNVNTKKNTVKQIINLSERPQMDSSARGWRVHHA